jgi:hypothetical protein
MKRPLVFMLLWASAATVWASSWETSSARTPSGALVQVGMPADEARHAIGSALDRKHGQARGKKGATETWVFHGDDGTYQVLVRHNQVQKITVTPKRD